METIEFSGMEKKTQERHGGAKQSSHRPKITGVSVTSESIS